MLAKWQKKCNDDSETANWINANAKNCPNPKCNSFIEKVVAFTAVREGPGRKYLCVELMRLYFQNGGCNHMHCGKCKIDFCWICMKDWRNHKSCASYKADSDDNDAVKKARNDLKRYIFYFNRYNGHLQSLKLEHKLKDLVNSRVDELRTEGVTFHAAQALHQHVDTLRICRQTLTYTYVFAYYLHPNNQTIIFEDNQNNLQGEVEKLSMYLEQGIEDVSGQVYVNTVCDQAKYCENRLRILVDHVREGLDKRTWVFAECN